MPARNRANDIKNQLKASAEYRLTEPRRKSYYYEGDIMECLACR